MNEQVDDNLSRAVIELGEPEALFAVSANRYLAKLGIGALLVLYGIVANYFWWVHGPGHFGHFEIVLLVVIPLTGVSLLWHMYRNRGLSVLVYPTGLLRIRRGEVDSFPWHEIKEITLKVKRMTEAVYERDEAGGLTSCVIPVDIPTFRIWDSGLTLTREDGMVVQIGAVLADFDELAEIVQRRTFIALWPRVWARYQAGKANDFGDLSINRHGLRYEKKLLSWLELGEAAISQEKLTVKQKNRWLPWLCKDVKSVANVHLLFALIKEAKRHNSRSVI